VIAPYGKARLVAETFRSILTAGVMSTLQGGIFILTSVSMIPMSGISWFCSTQ
jgi:hypothetical protein